MADNLTREARGALMAKVRQKDTKPEIVVRQSLHALGLRFRLHVNRLPGSPDLVFPRHRVALFVHGCFWHGHECRAGRPPSSNTNYWSKKIAENRQRDERQIEALQSLRWRVVIVWECETKVRDRAAAVQRWLLAIAPNR